MDRNQSGKQFDKSFKKTVYKIYVPQTGAAAFTMISLNSNPKNTAKITLLDKNKKITSTSTVISSDEDNGTMYYNIDVK